LIRHKKILLIDEEVIIRCSYGGVGDRLWVRETFFDNSFKPKDKENVLYRSDGEFQEQIPEEYIGAKWTPSIFMPRWASRIDREITGLGAERLQEITKMDARAEGSHFAPNYLESFQELWDSLNGKKYPWKGNWWVWKISW